MNCLPYLSIEKKDKTAKVYLSMNVTMTTYILNMTLSIVKKMSSIGNTLFMALCMIPSSKWHSNAMYSVACMWLICTLFGGCIYLYICKLSPPGRFKVKFGGIIIRKTLTQLAWLRYIDTWMVCTNAITTHGKRVWENCPSCVVVSDMADLNKLK